MQTQTALTAQNIRSGIKLAHTDPIVDGSFFTAQDRDGNWTVRQGSIELLLLDHADFAKFVVVQ